MHSITRSLKELHSIGRVILVTSTALVMALIGSANNVEASPPRVIMVLVPPSCEPVILDDWDENLTVVTSVPEQGAEVEVTGRPYLELVLFWENWRVREYEGEGKPLSTLPMEWADLYGRFYPATNEAPPALTLTEGLSRRALTEGLSRRAWRYAREMNPKGPAVLVRHGIPTRLGSDSPQIASCSSPASLGEVPAPPAAAAQPNAGSTPAISSSSPVAWGWVAGLAGGALALALGLGSLWVVRLRRR